MGAGSNAKWPTECPGSDPDVAEAPKTGYDPSSRSECRRDLRHKSRATMHKRCNAPVDDKNLKNPLENRSRGRVSVPFQKRPIRQHYRSFIIGDGRGGCRAKQLPKAPP